MADESRSTRRGRRNDPDRRDRIIRACLDVISESGVAGTSHRRVAAAAGVPLGSMTYHFTSMDDLLREAFTVFTTRVSDGFDRRLENAADAAEAQRAVVAMIREDVLARPADHVLTQELYTLAARDERFRDLTTDWMNRSRTALERHFDTVTARMLDALIEGLSIHRALHRVGSSAADVERAVARLCADGV